MTACRDDNGATANRRDSAAIGTSGAIIERDFILDQAEDGRAEIELSRMAAEHATNPRVKEFARMMVRDHTKAGADLREAAAAANVQLSTANEAKRDHLALQEDLARLTGKEFDRKYMSAMVDAHEQTVSEIEQKVESDSPQIRQWATQTLPTVREHLARAKELRKALDRKRTK